MAYTSFVVFLGAVVGSVLAQPYKQNATYAKPAAYAAKPAGYQAAPYAAAGAPYAAAAYGSDYGSSGSVTLQSGNVIMATGATGSGFVEPSGTEYYVNFQYELIRVDPSGIFERDQVKIADNVKYVYHGFDDSIWYVDMSGYLWRAHYNQAPTRIPNAPAGVKFTRVGPRSYDQGLAVDETGTLWHYAAHKFNRVQQASNVKDVNSGNDGSLWYLANNDQIYTYDWASYSWVLFNEVTGKSFDVYDVDRMVVGDANNYVRKRVNGQWVNTNEYCIEEMVIIDAFYCVTPTNAVKLVPYA